MGLLKKISSLLAFPSPPDRRKFYPFTVKCNHCGEIIQGQANMGNDLSAGNGEDADAGGFYCRKVLMGRQRCFQQIEVQLRFDKDRHLLDRQITGGQFVDE